MTNSPLGGPIVKLAQVTLDWKKNGEKHSFFIISWLKLQKNDYYNKPVFKKLKCEMSVPGN